MQLIASHTILSALADYLAGSGLFQKITFSLLDDLPHALGGLRSYPNSAALIIPGSWSFAHTILEEHNKPLSLQLTFNCQVLFTERDLGHASAPHLLEAGRQTADRLLELLTWSDLGIPGLLCLPDTLEPRTLAANQEPGRHILSLNLDFRYKTPNQNSHTL